MVREAVGNRPFASLRRTDISPLHVSNIRVAKQHFVQAHVLDVPVVLLDSTVAKTRRCIVQRDHPL